MTKKETAVQLLANTWASKGTLYYSDIEQALKIERLQHSQTWDAALDKYEVRAGNYMRAYEDFDDYYEQFKQD